MVNWTATILPVGSILLLFSTAFFAACIISYRNRRPLAIIDFCVITLAYIVGLVAFIIMSFLASRGSFKPYEIAFQNEGALLLYGKLIYCYVIMTRAAQALSKLSLAINCFRASHLVVRPWYRWISIAQLVLMTLNLATVALTTISCWPVTGRFTIQALTTRDWFKSHCVHFRVLLIFQSIFANATTLLLLGAGLPLLWKVSARYRKAGYAMLLIGLCCLVCSALQLAFILRHTSVDLEAAHWRECRRILIAIIASHLWVIAACLPHAYLFLCCFFKRSPTGTHPGFSTGFEKNPKSSIAVTAISKQSRVSFETYCTSLQSPQSSTFPGGVVVGGPQASPQSVTFPGVVLGGAGSTFVIEDSDDTSNWLAQPSPFAASFQQRLDAFQQRRGEWEDIYATDTTVEIRAFEDQFPGGTIAELPFVASATQGQSQGQDQERDIETDPVAKTDLQKAYFDEMTRFRRHLHEEARSAPASQTQGTPAQGRAPPQTSANPDDCEIVMY